MNESITIEDDAPQYAGVPTCTGYIVGIGVCGFPATHSYSLGFLCRSCVMIALVVATEFNVKPLPVAPSGIKEMLGL